MNISQQFPVIRDEFGTRPALEYSKGEFGESTYRGSDPRTGDSVSLTVSSGEWGGTEISGSIGGQHLDVYVSTDEFGYREIRGSGAEQYKELIKPQPDPWTDWM